MLANLHRDPKKRRAYLPGDFLPALKKKERVQAKVGVAVLKQLFVDQGN